MSETTPQASVQVTVNGTEREIFMSFNRLNRLTYLVGQIDNLQAVMLNPEMRSAVLLDLTEDRDLNGKVVLRHTEDSLDISQEDALALLDFAQEHIMNFFMIAAEKSLRLMNKNKGRLEQSNLIPTPTGQGS